jgi:hypothetical protein
MPTVFQFLHVFLAFLAVLGLFHPFGAMITDTACAFIFGALGCPKYLLVPGHKSEDTNVADNHFFTCFSVS